MSSSDSSEDEARQEVRHLIYVINSSLRQSIEPRVGSSLLDRNLYSMDETSFMYCFGLHRFQFHKLYTMIESRIRQNPNNFLTIGHIHPRDRLIICLRSLTTGSSFRDMSVQYEMPASVIATVVQETCRAIWQHLGPMVMQAPTEITWKKIGQGFMNLYKVPNCLGSIAGGYVNVMDQTSLDVLVLVDAYCKVVMVDVGRYSSNSDIGTALLRSKMLRRIDHNDLRIPANKPLYTGAAPVPYVIVGGAYFPEKPYFLNKYKPSECVDNDAHKVFNERISPARHVAKLAFNRLRSRWRMFQEPIPVPPAMVEGLILATCCLHNYFCLPTVQSAGEDKKAIRNITPDYLATLQAAIPNTKEIRCQYERYFMSEQGQVPWQWEPLNSSSI